MLPNITVADLIWSVVAIGVIIFIMFIMTWLSKIFGMIRMGKKRSARMREMFDERDIYNPIPKAEHKKKSSFK